MYCLNIVSVSLEFYSQTNVYACVWPVCTDDLQLLCLHTQTINPVYTSASLGSCLQAVLAGWPEVCSARPSTNVGKVIGNRGTEMLSRGMASTSRLFVCTIFQLSCLLSTTRNTPIIGQVRIVCWG